jgi:hypothetical protein
VNDFEEFGRSVRELAGEKSGWPFLCDGAPLDCDLFLVGINPATNIPLWPCWSSDSGVDKQSWLQLCLHKYGKYTRTRVRMEQLIRAVAPARVLETNVFHEFAPRESQLDKQQKSTVVFDFLIATLKPKLVFIHGRSAIRRLRRLTRSEFTLGEFVRVQYQDTKLDVLAEHHLSYQWSTERIEQLGKKLRDRLDMSPANNALQE